VPLKVAGAFHSSLMNEAADRLRDALSEIAFHAPSFPVISNVTGGPHASLDSIRASMVDQVVSPVRWYQGIHWLQAQGVGEYVECGPGKVLTGLVKRIDKQARLHTIHGLSTLEQVSADLAG
jgi:[acyl-carrier-protein] S-malonyltransferase